MSKVQIQVTVNVNNNHNIATHCMNAGGFGGFFTYTDECTLLTKPIDLNDNDEKLGFGRTCAQLLINGHSYEVICIKD